ncbi:MAG: GDP-mannose 4,6-dehydratase [Dehalococcoidia bacterium]|nr:GDP-mannose 4,6-dehydratase [Dehalococcoidia bacterium]
MRVLVTGAAGFIGRHMALRAALEGHEVLAVDNFVTGSREDVPIAPGITFELADVRDREFVEVARSFDPHQVYHLACPTGVPNLEPLAYEMLSTSYEGTRNVLDVARTTGARVVVASSAEVYGNPLLSPQSEEYTGNVDPTGPRSGYEEGKRVAETLSAIYAARWAVNVSVARIFNTYGEGMRIDDTRVVPSFIRAALDGAPLVVFGDGTQTRCHCHVIDTAHGLERLMVAGEPGRSYNIGSQVEVTVANLARLIIELTGTTSPIHRIPRPFEDHDRRLPDTTRAREELGWEPLLSLREGLGRTIADFRARSRTGPALAGTPAHEQVA